ncbi:hypothetical protein FA15DRAFT_471933 [Coprinopsis marcescibilis]|uniref:Uncharacterized protein n=1 Tax=Coprinopsis marcescibilis TaxID=230819 RepID=A0A5C3KS70_COPMA|nr:hypothetical protein FA15DRAFT_471933 [Coprinopsis marcescibilis]
MRNQGRNRRSRNHKDEDEGQLNTPRDEPHAKSSYSRHPHNSHFNESHRMSSSVQGRTLYDSGRERNAVPGRAVREDDWDMGGAPERYPYESYHHPEHDGYENSARRDGEGWVGSNEPRYSSRGSWPQSYHHGEPSASYQESSAWKSTSPKSKHYDSNSRYVKGYSPNPYQSRTPEPYTDHTPNPYLKSSDPYPPPPPPAFVSPSYGTTPNPYLSPTAYEERDSATSYGDNQYHRDYKHWRERDLRASPPDQRMDYGVVEKQRANQVFSRKDSRSSKGPKFQSDSGWSGRRKGKEWTEETAGRWEDVPVEPALPPSAPEDRSWEPADSWKSSNHQEPSSKNQRQQNPGRSQNKQNKPTRRGQSSGKQKREWRNENRNEEVNLNNWTRRDTSVSKKSAEKPQHSGSRRKHGRSPSRSRSRSPESIRSHRSSYRSRSSSPVAKRRRREFSSPMLRSPSPVGEVGTGRAHHRVGDRLSSRSRSPYQSTSQHRRRSPSTDRSSVRSRSPSPLENRRPVHRLPAANSAPQSSLVPTGGGGVGSGGKSKKSKKNGQKSKQPVCVFSVF